MSTSGWSDVRSTLTRPVFVKLNVQSAVPPPARAGRAYSASATTTTASTRRFHVISSSFSSSGRRVGSRDGIRTRRSARVQLGHPQLLASRHERGPGDLAGARTVVEEMDGGRALDVGHVDGRGAVEGDLPQRHHPRVARALVTGVAHGVDLAPVARPARLRPLDAQAPAGRAGRGAEGELAVVAAAGQ